MPKKKWFCRVAPSLGALEGHPNDVWGTETYDFKKHRYENLIQFGAYDLRDYLTLFWHRGHKAILWAGSDLRNLDEGFAFNDGKLKWLSKLTHGWFNKLVLHILRDAEHWVENEWEHGILKKFDIKSRISPSFMGNVDEYEVYFNQGNKVWLSASEGRQEEYGWWRIEDYIAADFPNIEFHLYGAGWSTAHLNVFCHGRVPKEQMNAEVKKMQGSLRLNYTDGFSEVTAKAILWGQYAYTTLYNPHTQYKDVENPLFLFLEKLPKKVGPDFEARNYYLPRLNHYPWNVHKKA